MLRVTSDPSRQDRALIQGRYETTTHHLAHGFDSFFGFKSGYIDSYQHTDSTGAPDLFENNEPAKATGYMTDLITQRSVAFINDHAKSPAAGARVGTDAKLEGIDLLPLLGRGTKPVSRTLFWRVNTAGLNQRAVRIGDWKLLIDGNVRLLLFDVSKDLGERNDVAAANTPVVRRLHQALLAWEKDVDAEAKTLAGRAGQPVPERE